MWKLGAEEPVSWNHSPSSIEAASITACPTYNSATSPLHQAEGISELGRNSEEKKLTADEPNIQPARKSVTLAIVTGW